MNIDEFIEHTQETAKEHRSHADFFDIDNPMRVACIKSAQDCEQLAEWLEKSKEYQRLEEHGLLLRLPCKVGDTIWNYSYFGLREYKVTHIDFNRSGDLYFDCECGVAYAIKCYTEDFGKTVFLTKSEAEARLKELRGGENGSME